jgi:hypothetical protein
MADPVMSSYFHTSSDVALLAAVFAALTSSQLSNVSPMGYEKGMNKFSALICGLNLLQAVSLAFVVFDTYWSVRGGLSHHSKATDYDIFSVFAIIHVFALPISFAIEPYSRKSESSPGYVLYILSFILSAVITTFAIIMAYYANSDKQADFTNATWFSVVIAIVSAIKLASFAFGFKLMYWKPKKQVV